MLGKDDNFSYVKNLRSFSNEELVSVFNEFKENGGQTLYVYTTATDVKQMYDYLNAYFDSGLNKVIFHFNSGINDEINKCLDYFNRKGLLIESSEV